MNFREHFFSYLLTLFIVLFVGASIVRFMVVHDYTVAFEGECDPATSSCFVGCNDDECTESHYFVKIQKYVPDLFEQCGADITECADAYVCLPSDRGCTIQFCEPNSPDEECDSVTNESIDQSSEQTSLSE